MVDVTAAGRVDACDGARVDVRLHTRAAVSHDYIDGGVVVPALHALQLLGLCWVSQPPECRTAATPCELVLPNTCLSQERCEATLRGKTLLMQRRCFAMVLVVYYWVDTLWQAGVLFWPDPVISKQEHTLRLLKETRFPAYFALCVAEAHIYLSSVVPDFAAVQESTGGLQTDSAKHSCEDMRTDRKDSRATKVISGIRRMSGQAVALCDVVDLRPVCIHISTVAPHLQ